MLSVVHPAILRARRGEPEEKEKEPDEYLTLAEMETRYVRKVMRKVGGNKAAAARILGLHRRSLYRLLEAIEKGRWRNRTHLPSGTSLK